MSGRRDKEELAGLAEVAEILRTSRAQALRWTKRDDFPQPVARLRATPVWRRRDVERWAREAGRRHQR